MVGNMIVVELIIWIREDFCFLILLFEFFVFLDMMVNFFVNLILMNFEESYIRLEFIGKNFCIYNFWVY